MFENTALGSVPATETLVPEPSVDGPLEPLACGAFGTWEGQPFQVTGAAELEDGAGRWRIWCLEADQSTAGWLHERDDELLLVMPVEHLEDGLDFELLNPGAELELGSELFLVERRRISRVTSTQGKSSFAVDEVVCWVQLRSANQRLWLQFRQDDVEVYEVASVALSDLRLGNPAMPVTSIAVETPANQPALTSKTTLTLGATGHLLGDTYTVAGVYSQSSHLEGYSSRRTEYLVRTARNQALWLSEQDDGKWFVRERSWTWPKAHGRNAWLQGTKFDFAVNHVATVDQALGALPASVAVGESLHHLEYSASGLGGGMREGVVLLRRASSEELVWEVCNPIDGDDVARAFDVELPKPVVRAKKPKAVVRTTLQDLAGPLRLAGYGNLVMLVLHPTFLGLALGVVSLLGIGSMSAFSWLLEGEKL